MTGPLDILERLRNAEHDPYSCIRHPDQRTFLAGDAADEIELLRVERDDLASRWANAESNLADCDSDLRTMQRERDELRADRDSWRSQAEDRVVDWDAMRAERDELRARIAAAPVIITDGTIQWAIHHLDNCRVRLVKDEP